MAWGVAPGNAPSMHARGAEGRRFQRGTRSRRVGPFARRMGSRKRCSSRCSRPSRLLVEVRECRPERDVPVQRPGADATVPAAGDLIREPMQPVGGIRVQLDEAAHVADLRWHSDQVTAVQAQMRHLGELRDRRRQFDDLRPDLGGELLRGPEHGPAVVGGIFAAATAVPTWIPSGEKGPTDRTTPVT
jgi:hypothetical protein